jgi:hypothetical protein
MNYFQNQAKYRIEGGDDVFKNILWAVKYKS